MDYETIIEHGLGVAMPSEVMVLKLACEYVLKLTKIFEAEMHSLLEKDLEGKDFKSNCKSFDRSLWKLDEYASEGKHPTFEYLGDLLRCRATFENVNNLIFAYGKIAEKFKIIKLKNKLQSGLKNITFNFIYKGIIAEMQLVHGSIAAELENHQLYEAIRCRSIVELFDVVEKWGGYNHLSEKDEVEGTVVDSRPAKNTKIEHEKYISHSFDHAPKDSQIRLIRTIELGVTDLLSDTWDTDINLDNETVEIIVEANNNSIVNIETSKDRLNSQSSNFVSMKLNGKEKFITEVKGTYNMDSGITSLKLLNSSEVVLTASKPSSSDKNFEIKLPTGYYLVGFGGKRTKSVPNSNSPSTVLSLYGWVTKLEPFVQSKNGSRYEGQYMNLQRHGYGVYEHDGNRYEGMWEQDFENGKGTKFYKNGERYTGSWSKGQRNGEGTHHYVTGDTYTGFWERDMRHGIGEQHYENGDYYVGNWSEDLKAGKGKLHFVMNKKPAVYIGEFNNDLPHGKCSIMIKELNFSFEGIVTSGVQNRKGKATFMIHEEEGEWISGKKEGPGKITYSSGEEIIGTWANGLLEGKALFKDSKGETSECTYREGMIISGRGMKLGQKLQKYIGFFLNGLPEGYGHSWNSEGRLEYEGQWTIGKKHGRGTVYDPWGGKTEGNWSYDKLLGKAIHTTKDSKVSENDYYNGVAKDKSKISIHIVPNGTVTVGIISPDKEMKAYYPDGSSFEGIKSKMGSKGTYITVDNRKISGHFKAFGPREYLQYQREDGTNSLFVLHNQGYVEEQHRIDCYPPGKKIISWPGRGKIFEGNFEGGCPIGEGAYYDLEGNAHVNYYNDGVPQNGKGVSLDFTSSYAYEGEFKASEFHGYGVKYTCENMYLDKIYEGSWANGKKHGFGKIYSDGILLFEGNFVNDKKDGVGIWYGEDGQKYEGTYKNDKIVKGKYLEYKGEFKRDYFIGDVGDDPDIRFIKEYIDRTLIAEYFMTNKKKNGEGKLYRKSGALWFEGNFENNLPADKGTYYDENGTPFEGLYEKGGNKEGLGIKIDMSNQYIYEGEFANKAYSGKGKLYTLDGLLIYEGEWANGRKQGKGKGYKLVREDPESETNFKFFSVLEYIGDFYANEFHGQGVSYYPDGEICYQGEWKQGFYEGKGLFYDKENQYSSEGTFSGDYISGKVVFTSNGERLECVCEEGRILSGAGVRIMNKNFRYEGQFEDNSISGNGKLYYQKKLIFEGQFKNDLMEGEGIYYSESGEKWTGVYRKGKLFSGKGFEYDEFASFVGEAVDGKKNGFGIMYSKGKITYEGWWKDGAYDGQGTLIGFNWRFEGEFTNGLKASGKTYSSEGDLLSEASYLNDRFHGKVTCYYRGQEYNGNYENGVLIEGEGLEEDRVRSIRIKLTSGKFILEGTDNDYYIGDAVNGKKNGIGADFDMKTNIKLFEGEYQDGKLKGQAKSFYQDGTVEYDGSWDNSEKKGRGSYYDKTGNLIYEGEFSSNKFHGTGKLYARSEVYEGVYSNGAIVKGEGRIEMDMGIYLGQVLESKPNSKGKFYRGDSLEFEGDWVYGEFKSGAQSMYAKDRLVGKIHANFVKKKPEGSGKYENMKGEQYPISCQEGRIKSGFGTILYGEEYYQGEIQNFLEHGGGIYHTYSGEVFRGIYEFGRILEGNGVLYFDKERRFKFEGEFKYGFKHGKGITSEIHGSKKYEGEWAEDKPIKGEAIYFYENGDRYEGGWLNGKKEGKGTYYSKSGVKYEAYWKNGLNKLAIINIV